MTRHSLSINNEDSAIHKYTGLLTQDEFRLRYCLMKARINSGYTPEELSFLIGKPGFYMSDYEEMNNGIKLTLEDFEMLSRILINLYPEVLPLDIDDFGNGEKRLVRCRREAIYGDYRYSFKHPWTIEGKNSEIHLKEPVFRLDKTAAKVMGEEVAQGVDALLKTDFFLNKKRTAFEIFMEVKPPEKYLPFIRPCLLMPVVYDLVKEQLLTIVKKRNRIYYQTGESNPKPNGPKVKLDKNG